MAASTIGAQGVVGRRHGAIMAAGRPANANWELAAAPAATCSTWSATAGARPISARLDGEDPGIDPALVDAHLARCRGLPLVRGRRRRRPPGQRVGVAPAVPDLSRRVRKAVAVADRASRWSVVRALLVVVAVQIIGFSLPALILGDEHETATHAARHLGAFTAAYGVGLLVVAVRPARARTMLPVAAVLAGALVITAVVDMANGRVPLVGEAQHLPELLSVVLVWLLAVPAPRRTAPVDRPSARRRSRGAAATTPTPTSPDGSARSVTVVPRPSRGHEVAHPDPDHHVVGAGERDVGDDVELAGVERVDDRPQRTDAERRLGELDRRRVDRHQRLARRVEQRRAPSCSARPGRDERVRRGAGAPDDSGTSTGCGATVVTGAAGAEAMRSASG